MKKTYYVMINNKATFSVYVLDESFQSGNEWYTPVDVKYAGLSSQALLETKNTKDIDTILSDPELQDAIASVWQNYFKEGIIRPFEMSWSVTRSKLSFTNDNRPDN